MVLAFNFGTLHLTGEAVISGAGWTSRWWGSSISTAGFPYLIGHLDLPVYGATPKLAEQRMSFIAEQVALFFTNTGGGEGTPLASDVPTAHVQDHLNYWTEYLQTQWYTEQELTIALYKLLSGFRVQNPAVLLATALEVNSVRTVHDRIARARKDLQLPDYGQGRSHV